MLRWAWVVALGFVVACSPPGRRGEDEEDVASDAGPGTDAGSTACRLDAECSSGHCDRSRGTCVGCLSADHCGANEACSAGRCVPRVSCTSSRTCPGQVCDSAKGYCVDCVGDNDCASGEKCAGNVCLAAPKACQSSRECSGAGQVCEPVSHVCVDCASDTDCEAGRYCGADRTCVAQVCAPGESHCADASRRTVCDAHGAGWVDQPCGANETCDAGACRTRICIPNSSSCRSTTTRLVCDATGLSQTEQPCAAGESCDGGACRTRICQPGAVDCGSGTERRTCNADGLGYTTESCPGYANATGLCAQGVCTYDCRPGWSECDGVTADGCETSLSSPDTCGSCTNRCPSAPNASATCNGSQCGLSCVSGSRMCGGSCVPDQVTEACDGVDNDCDGQVDEGCGSGTCASPYLVGPSGGTLSGIMSGYSTTTGSCGYSGGVDRIFRWTPARSGTATINLSGDYYPVSLYMRSGSCSGSEIACRSSQQWSSPTLNPAVTAGVTYYIVVDAQWSGTTVPPGYTLPHWNLTVTPP